MAAAPLQNAMQYGAVPSTPDSLTGAYQLLGTAKGIQVVQQRRFIDTCDCEFNNWYVVKDAQGRDLFFIEEDSNCFEKNCLAGECKSWRMDGYHLTAAGWTGDPTNRGAKFMHLERPCTLTCCCFNRPQVFVQDGLGQQLGTLKDPCTFCSLKTEVYPGNSDVAAYHTNGSLCQPGLCCPWPCCGCKIDFPIKEAKSGQELAMMTKVWQMGDICPMCYKEWSHMDVDFAGVGDAGHRLLLLGTAIFTQMLYFDKRNRSDD